MGDFGPAAVRDRCGCKDCCCRREGERAGGEQSNSGQGRADPLRTGQLICSSEVSTSGSLPH